MLQDVASQAGAGRSGSGPTEVPAIQPDSGLGALALVASFFQIPCEPAQVRHNLGLGQAPFSSVDIVRGARRLGLKGRLLQNQKPSRIDGIPLPAILQVDDGRFVVLGRRLEDGKLRIIDPVAHTAEHVELEEFLSRWTGTIVLLARRANLQTALKSFGLSWFLPSVWRYRKPLVTVLVASLFIQLCALITPVFFQITIDKVLVHRGYSTLTLVAVGLVVLGLFHVVLQYLRSYILTHTASRIDVELGARLFDHLMRLPLGISKQELPARPSRGCEN